jgi:hypothetical protein
MTVVYYYIAPRERDLHTKLLDVLRDLKLTIAQCASVGYLQSVEGLVVVSEETATEHESLLGEPLGLVKIPANPSDADIEEFKKSLLERKKTFEKPVQKTRSLL